jgi:hypothetical protein
MSMTALQTLRITVQEFNKVEPRGVTSNRQTKKLGD